MILVQIATALAIGAYVVLSKDARPKRPNATPRESLQSSRRCSSWTSQRASDLALMLCSRYSSQINPRLAGLKAERLGRTAASAVASAPNQLASVAAN